MDQEALYALNSYVSLMKIAPRPAKLSEKDAIFGVPQRISTLDTIFSMLLDSVRGSGFKSQRKVQSNTYSSSSSIASEEVMKHKCSLADILNAASESPVNQSKKRKISLIEVESLSLSRTTSQGSFSSADCTLSPKAPHSAQKKTQIRFPKPSDFCHICRRTKKTQPLVVCSNFQQGTCKKVICKRCFEENRWNWDQSTMRKEEWKCSHCTDSCPPDAQCRTYTKINAKRKSKAVNIILPLT